jgi:hypothetical protein
MYAESMPRFRRVPLSRTWIAVGAVGLLVGLVLLAAGAVLAEVLGPSAEPLLMGPFRWSMASGVV